MSVWSLLFTKNTTSSSSDEQDIFNPVVVYLWGSITFFIIAMVLSEFASRRRDVQTDNVYMCFLMAVLWPLFACALLFVAIWTFATRRR